MGIFGGLFAKGMGKAQRYGIKLRQVTGKIARREGRERQELKNTAIKNLDEYNLSKAKMAILGILIPIIRQESMAVADVQRTIQAESAGMNAEITVQRSLDAVMEVMKQRKLSQEDREKIQQILNKEKQAEGQVSSLAVKAVQQTDALRNNLNKQRAEINNLLNKVKTQQKDLKIEEKEEKKVAKETSANVQGATSLTSNPEGLSS